MGNKPPRWSSRVWVIGCACTLVIGWMTGSAWQAWAAENRVISACLNATGQVLSLQLGIPPSSRKCARVLSWNQSGSPGQQGPKGPPGDPGTRWFFQAEQPEGAAEGDFWVDSDNGRLWRYDGTGWIFTEFALLPVSNGGGGGGPFSGGGGGGQ